MIERGRKRRAERAVARIAVEDEHRRARDSRCRRCEPAAQAQAVGCVEGNIFRSRENTVDRRDVLGSGEINEAALTEPHRRQQDGDRGHQGQ